MQAPALLLEIGPTLVILLMAEEGAEPVLPIPVANLAPAPFSP